MRLTIARVGPGEPKVSRSSPQRLQKLRAMRTDSSASSSGHKIGRKSEEKRADPKTETRITHKKKKKKTHKWTMVIKDKERSLLRKKSYRPKGGAEGTRRNVRGKNSTFGQRRRHTSSPRGEQCQSPKNTRGL